MSFCAPLQTVPGLRRGCSFAAASPHRSSGGSHELFWQAFAQLFALPDDTVVSGHGPSRPWAERPIPRGLTSEHTVNPAVNHPSGAQPVAFPGEADDAEQAAIERHIAGCGLPQAPSGGSESAAGGLRRPKAVRRGAEGRGGDRPLPMAFRASRQDQRLFMRRHGRGLPGLYRTRTASPQAFIIPTRFAIPGPWAPSAKAPRARIPTS
jgi:hypothetical protein